jgi:chemotaxis signal transduction protein
VIMNINNTASNHAANKVVVLAIDGLQLIVPQADIRTVESITDVAVADKMPKSVGWINYRGQRWPVVCLSHELLLLNVVPASRRACVMLAFDGNYLGLLCDDAKVLANFVQQSYFVPASMRKLESPLTGLVQYEQGLACLSDASHLGSYVNAYANLTVLMQEEVH